MLELSVHGLAGQLCELSIGLACTVGEAKEAIEAAACVPKPVQRLFLGTFELNSDAETLLSALQQSGTSPTERLEEVAEGYRPEERKITAEVTLVRRSSEQAEWLARLLCKGGLEALKNAPPEVLSDREVMTAAADIDVDIAKSLAMKSLWADREFVLEMTRRDGSSLSKASEALRADRELALQAVADVTGGGGLAAVAHELWADSSFAREAVTLNCWALRMATALRGDVDVAHAAVQQNWRVLKLITQDCRANADVCLTALKQDWRALEHVPSGVWAEKLFALQVCDFNSIALQYVAPTLQQDREVVLAAIRQGGQALEYAAKELRNCPTVVMEAVSQDGLALKFVSKELRADRRVVLAAIAQNAEALEFASAELRGDREVVLAATRRRPRALRHAASRLRAELQ
eukprot:TRINITY_DN52575_c0_g1_i1.p1 TRINITY_DN52575_c0_g1~~TRINITY_DN52575_c0_g1_i1.p1  ORF type:complete len:406 (+),score=96.84 TRINITY_DN52575_c0_g1_i1:42-1259(+)